MGDYNLWNIKLNISADTEQAAAKIRSTNQCLFLERALTQKSQAEGFWVDVLNSYLICSNTFLKAPHGGD